MQFNTPKTFIHLGNTLHSISNKMLVNITHIISNVKNIKKSVAKSNEVYYNKHVDFNTLKRENTKGDNKMSKLTYKQEGDYQIPNLTLGLEEYPDRVGKYGILREKYLKEHKRSTVSLMIMDGSYWPHLCEIDKQAEEQVDLIMEQMMKAQNVTEELKEKDQMLWVQKVTNIKAQAEEIVLRELIYV